jgi:hypothetical protein
MMRATPTRRGQRQQRGAAWVDPFPVMTEVLPEGERGKVKIKHFTVTKRGDFNGAMGDPGPLQARPPGTWVALEIDGIGWMYDVPDERRWNLPIVEAARGDVLIGGLGLGMILHPILKKPEVVSVTVLENNEDVAALVLPSLEGVEGREKLSVVFADAEHWIPPGWHRVRPDGKIGAFGTPAPGPEACFYNAIWLDCVPCYAAQGWWIRWAAPGSSGSSPSYGTGRAASSGIGH